MTFKLHWPEDMGGVHSSRFAAVEIFTTGFDDGTNKRFITADCATMGEFDAQIEYLKRQLDEVQKEAHKKFAALTAPHPHPRGKK